MKFNFRCFTSPVKIETAAVIENYIKIARVVFLSYQPRKRENNETKMYWQHWDWPSGIVGKDTVCSAGIPYEHQFRSQLTASDLEKAVEGSSGAQTPAAHIRELDKVPGFGLTQP